MRLWGQIYKDGQKQADALVQIDIKKRAELHGRDELIYTGLTDLAHELDLERPVMVKKHLDDLFTFGRTVFRPHDFMESIEFDRLVVELIADI